MGLGQLCAGTLKMQAQAALRLPLVYVLISFCP